jgi:formamidopyrimidine-DNA glycosylase
MPELPDVETVVRSLRPHLVGRRFVRVEQRRADLREELPPNFARRVQGRRVEAIKRRAKYILIHLDDGNVLVVHFGMTGNLVLARKRDSAGAHEHVAFTLDDGHVLQFTDQRRFGLMDLIPDEEITTHKRFAGIGPEPLSPDFTAAKLAEKLRGRRGPIKTALLDQGIVAGMGNVYACEALFVAGISPKRNAGTVARHRATRLVAAIKAVLKRAIAAGGTVPPRRAVYGREGQRCPDCDCRSSVKRIVQSGRSTFYCAKRQR